MSVGAFEAVRRLRGSGVAAAGKHLGRLVDPGRIGAPWKVKKVNAKTKCAG